VIVKNGGGREAGFEDFGLVFLRIVCETRYLFLQLPWLRGYKDCTLATIHFPGKNNSAPNTSTFNMEGRTGRVGELEGFGDASDQATISTAEQMCFRL